MLGATQIMTLPLVRKNLLANQAFHTTVMHWCWVQLAFLFQGVSFFHWQAGASLDADALVLGSTNFSIEGSFLHSQTGASLDADALMLDSSNSSLGDSNCGRSLLPSLGWFHDAQLLHLPHGERGLEFFLLDSSIFSISASPLSINKGNKTRALYTSSTMRTCCCFTGDIHWDIKRGNRETINTGGTGLTIY